MKYADMTDEQLNAAYLSAENERRQLMAQYDDGADIDDAVFDVLDTRLFQIDDELCARDLPLPR
jgi:hypothetical protein